MDEPEKPFACTIPDCGMTFTNEDHLNVHTKKHDMVLQLGLEQKAAFVADQTPTPTRFIRNCEEVGLFQDLQNVNPFDEGFKRAMEAKVGVLSIDSTATPSSSDELHTPQMVFPLIDGDSTLHSTTNNKNITISRSSSDESGAIKEFETTTISKLTNEVTTISRIVNKTEEKHLDNSKNDIRKDSVSYTNNIIKISNMVRKDSVEKNPVQTLIYEDTVIRDRNITSKDTTDKVQNSCLEIPPILSQKSLDFIVDSLNSDFDEAKKKAKSDDEFEVIIKLPNGKQVKMRAVDEIDKPNAKEALKKVITEKVEAKNSIKRLNSVVVPNVQSVQSVVVPNVNNLVTGTLIPVTLVNGLVPITPLKVNRTFDKKPVKRKVSRPTESAKSGDDKASSSKIEKRNLAAEDLDSRSAASRRYRARLKETYERQTQENNQLRELNERLLAEKALLKNIISEHLTTCPTAGDMMAIMEKLKYTGTEL